MIWPLLSSPLNILDSGALLTRLKALARIGPIGLIHSKHVLEHTYDPSTIIKLASQLQEPGGYFILSLPNVLGEMSLLTLMFFPHLHAFSADSLIHLMNRNGYEIINTDYTTNTENYLVARRSNSSLRQQASDINHREALINKFRNGLFLREYDFNPRILWFKRSKEKGGQINGDLISRICFNFQRRNDRIVAALIEDLKTRYTSFEDSPIEVQFEGDVMLSYK